MLAAPATTEIVRPTLPQIMALGGIELGGIGLDLDDDQGEAWVPASDEDLILDLDGDIGVTGTDPVTAWADQSGRSNTFATAGGNLPSVGAWSGGQGTVLFEAVNAEVMAKASFAQDAANAYIVTAALDLKSAGAANQYLLGVGGVGIKAHAGSAGPGIFDGTAHRGAGASVTGEQVLTWVLDPSGTPSVSFYRNGILLGTDSYDGTFTMAGTVYLGRFSSAVQYLDAELARLLVFNTATASLVSKVNAYMVGRYL